MKRSMEKLRVEYGSAPLLEEDLPVDPLQLLTKWLAEAIAVGVPEPNGISLATVSALGHPSCRTVLLKEIERDRLIFYTHYASRKGEQLAKHPEAAITFWWKEIYRQVCLEGKVSKVSRAKSRSYFAKRPRGAQLAAVATAQSSPLASRAEIEESYQRLQKKYRGKAIPCPQGWGGYQLIPERVEFWQGRKNRLHDRFLYVRMEKEWLVSRLAP